MSTLADEERALKMIERLQKVAPHPTLVTAAKRIRRRLNAMPMSEIIAKMPGDGVTDKARKLGVTRQTLYYWINGVTRPGPMMSRTLAKLTGIDADVIRGTDAAA